MDHDSAFPEFASARRRRLAVVGVVVAGLFGGGGALAASQQLGHHAPDSASRPTSLPVPSAGKKWVGVGRTVVAVPESWPVIAGIYCPGPKMPFVTVTRWHVTTGCMPITDPSRPPASVDIQGTTSGRFTATLQLGPGGRHGLTQNSLEATRTTLPAGWLAVPSGEPYGGAGSPSVTSEVAALEEAGFRVELRHAPTGTRWERVTTDPEIGTPARVGSTVVLYDHGVVASTATLQGRLSWVGGPPPGGPEPHPGTIHVVDADDSVDQTAQAHDDGTWTMLLPPGTYQVRATSPGFGSLSGGFDACSAGRDVTVRAHETVTVNVSCQLR